MKTLAVVIIPAALIVSTATVHALPIKKVYADQAQGLVGNGLELTLYPGYDLVISMPKGETVTFVRLGDIKRIGFGANGSLCSVEAGSGNEECAANGANVIFFRPIAPIPFPNMLSSPDDSTQATIITSDANGQHVYPILLQIGKGRPPYTTVQIEPADAKPKPLPRWPHSTTVSNPKPVSPGYVPPARPLRESRVGSEPGKTRPLNTSQSRASEFSLSNESPARRVAPSMPEGNLRAPGASFTRFNEAALHNTISDTNLMPKPSQQTVRAPTPKQVPTSVSLPTRVTAQQKVASPALRSSRKTPQQLRIASGLLPSAKPLHRATTTKVSPFRKRPERRTVAISSPTLQADKLQQSIDDANAIAFGLRTANDNGQIKLRTTMWRKAQSAIRLLRRGKTREEAADQADIPLHTLTQLIKWGQERP